MKSSITLFLIAAFSAVAMGNEPPLIRAALPAFPNEVRFSDTNELFILGGAESLVWLDNATNTWRQFRRNSQVTLKHAEYQSSVLDISHDGKTVLVRHYLQTQSPSVFELQRFPSGTILSLDRRDQFSFWDVPSGRLLQMLDRSEYDTVNFARFLPDGKSIVIWGTRYTKGPSIEWDGQGRYSFNAEKEFAVDLYDVNNGKLAKELGTTKTMGQGFGISSDGTWVVVSGGKQNSKRDKKEMKLFNVHTGSEVSLQDGPWRILGPMSPWEEGVTHAEFTKGNNLLWTPKGWWDISKREVVSEQWMTNISDALAARDHPESNDPRPSGRFLTPDGRLFFLPGRRSPEAIEISSGELLTASKKLKGHRSPIANWAFSPDMNYLATVSVDAELIKWDLTHKDVNWKR